MIALDEIYHMVPLLSSNLSKTKSHYKGMHKRGRGRDLSWGRLCKLNFGRIFLDSHRWPKRKTSLNLSQSHEICLLLQKSNNFYSKSHIFCHLSFPPSYFLDFIPPPLMHLVLILRIFVLCNTWNTLVFSLEIWFFLTQTRSLCFNIQTLESWYS